MWWSCEERLKGKRTEHCFESDHYLDYFAKSVFNDRGALLLENELWAEWQRCGRYRGEIHCFASVSH